MSVEPSVIDYIDQLEDLINNGRRIPLTPNVVVSEEDCLDLIERTRLGLPEAVTEAHHLLQERAHLIAEARQEANSLLQQGQEDARRLVEEARVEADRIRQAAEQHGANLVADHTVVREATQRANQHLEAAEHEAATVRLEADRYAREVMEHLEEHLRRTLSAVERGLDTLAGPDGEPPPRRGRGRS